MQLAAGQILRECGQTNPGALIIEVWLLSADQSFEDAFWSGA
jgi:hypothetical protein